jgi:hypothetical protein
LIIGHAGTLEATTRQISGSEMRPYLEFNSTGKNKILFKEKLIKRKE